jgi:hypothetical protein
MALPTTQSRSRILGIVSIIFGILGLISYWWAPLGIVLSLTGLVMGVVGFMGSVRRAAEMTVLAVGILLSVAGLVLGLVVASLGRERVQLMPYR